MGAAESLEWAGQKKVKEHRDLTENQNYILEVERGHINLRDT